MKSLLKIVFISIITTSCMSWKITLNKSENLNNAIQYAIYDFLNTGKLFKKDTVFSVKVEDINNETIGISIIGSENKLFPTNENKIGSNNPNFPTKYFVMNNKLFIWYDSTTNVSVNLINILSKYNHIDSLNANGIIRIPDLSIDDSKEAMHYYFCKNNLTKYKKVKTKIAMGYYELPKLYCNQK